MMGKFKAPFPYFGGKSRIADVVWSRFGPDVQNYIEPFAGSIAVLLARDTTRIGVETINDRDGYVVNFWRAVSADWRAVAKWADWPVSELDLHARHRWLVEHRDWLEDRLRGDPFGYDARMAGWWVWGINSWIGSGWCSAACLHRSMPYLSRRGTGLNRKTDRAGVVGLPGPRRRAYIEQQLSALFDRLRDVRIISGDWRRVLGKSVVSRCGTNAVFLDPPYPHAERDRVYARDENVFYEVADWAAEHWDDPKLRIALCGYAGTWRPPGGETYTWKTSGGYGLQSNKRGRVNCTREVVWFSPACLSLGAARTRRAI